MPPDKTTTALGSGDGEPQLSPSEMAAMTKLHKAGLDEKHWTQKEKAELTSALNKAYGPASVLHGGDFAKLRRWLEKVGFFA